MICAPFNFLPSLAAVLLLAAGSPPLQAQDSTPRDQIYYFPHLAVGASWQTTITYINYSREEVTCQTDFLSDDGSPLMVSFAELGTVPSRTDVLPPGGSVHQETNVELSAPLAPGWALATCTGPVQASLLFRWYNSEGMPVAEAGVNAATVPATRFVTFAEQGEGKNGTGVAYANPSDTAALVTFTARDADGEVRATKDLMLPPNGHGAQNMPTLFDLSSFTGSLEVTSTEPIVSLSLNFEAASGFSSLPPGELDAAAQGSTTYYFPHLAVGASWQTTITYINYSREEVTCQTDFISDHGSPLMVSFAELGTVDSRTDVLPPGGSVHQETNVELSAPLAPGWALANCSGPVQASLLFRWYNSEGMPVAEAGVNAATVPATRFVTFAEQGEGKNGTGVAYANPSDTAALVTFTARDTDGEVLAIEDLMLPPNWHGAQNMPTLFDLSSFTGSLEVTSTEPIVSLSLNFEAAPVFSSLPPGETIDIPGVMLAPADEAAFNDLFVGKRAATNFPTAYVDFVSPGRFRETLFAVTSTGSYTYRNTGSDAGTLTFNYDDGDRCTAHLTFTSATMGTATSTCDDGSSVEYNWRIVEIPASGAPDLVIQTPLVSDSSPNAGGSFTLSATVRNQGNGLSASTTLRYYRSSDATISTSDTAVGTDTVGGLAASGTSAESISLTAPSTAGTYYYGACVDPVSGESDTGNNCSNSSAVTVPSGPMAVAIPDANLRAAIEMALGKASGAPITEAEMSTLTELHATGAGIRDLSGLEYAASLTYLDLRYNYNIGDISPLLGLTNLETFYLGCNRFTDLSPLSGLTNLTDLNIGGNAFADISSLSGLTNLTRLHVGNNDITDISPLSGLINLTELGLGGNELTDISHLVGLTNLEHLVLLRNNLTDLSPLSGLTKLNYLDLRHNAITDISPLSGLTNLGRLWLRNNDIADIPTLSVRSYLGLADNEIRDISGLSGASNLRSLDLGGNDIIDLSPLSGLAQLNTLRLGFNSIIDISPLAGLTSVSLLDLKFNSITDISSLSVLTGVAALDLRGNPLSESSISDHIPVLRSGGVRVLFNSLRKGDFDIELVFLDDVTDHQKNVIHYAARRWMSVIVGDLPDYALAQEVSGTCGGQPYEIPSGERIDDLRIYVSTSVSATFSIGRGSPHVLRETTQLPVVGCMAVRLEAPSFVFSVGLHEIGHVLGFGTLWNKFGYLHDLSFSDSSADTQFNGPRAIAAFDEAGGRDYAGKKVPVAKQDGAHWRTSELWGDIMLPSRWGEEALSAITVQSLADLGYVVDVTEADDYTLPGAAAAQASAKQAVAMPAIPGDDPLSGRLASPTQAEPKLWCGLDGEREPIYVVDQQGRVIRTIGN